MVAEAHFKNANSLANLTARYFYVSFGRQSIRCIRLRKFLGVLGMGLAGWFYMFSVASRIKLGGFTNTSY